MQCQNKALNELHRVERLEKDKFKTRCAKVALDTACPKGSPCGIETSGASTVVTGQAALTFMNSNYYTWMNGYKQTLMSAARGWNWNSFGRKFDMFTLRGWQGSALLAFVSFAAAVGGIGCVVAAVRFARRHGNRNVNLVDPEALELIDEPEE